MTINELLQIAIDKKASDLHIIPDFYPAIRINNELYPLRNQELITEETAKKLIFSILSENQREDLINNKEIDLSYGFNNDRFRVNIYTSKNKFAAAFRLIPPNIKTIEELNLLPIMHEFAKYKQGLVLVTGPTGEGKSTSLASIINEINLKEARHIVTIEDPIEFTYPPGKSIISQRELHHDTFSFDVALRSVLREDPDVVMIGEMRDYETIQAALTVAETGHLVFSTLHTRSAAESIDRIIDTFPTRQQNQIRNQLSSVLIAIVAQRLLPNNVDGSRIPAMEVMMNNSATASLMREGKIFMIDNVIATSANQNMILFEKDLQRLYNNGVITKETALTFAIRPHVINKFIT